MEASGDKLRLVFFGSGAFGLPTLRHLAARHEVLAIVTQPDRPAGRGGKETPTPIAEWAARDASVRDVVIRKPERISVASEIEAIRALPAHAWVVIAYGQKLPRALLADRFAINLHASLLPRWRGAAPINAAMLAGDPETGNSVITLADQMDAGLVLAQSKRAIGPTMTAGELHDALSADGPALVERVLQEHCDVERRGSGGAALTGMVQDPSRVTLAPKLSKADGWVDFGASARRCRERIHALTPWPGVAVELHGPMVKLLRVRDEAADKDVAASVGATGTLFDPEQGLVACGDGTTLRLLEVQPAGKRAMAWPDFARGAHLRGGERLTSVMPVPPGAGGDARGGGR